MREGFALRGPLETVLNLASAWVERAKLLEAWPLDPGAEPGLAFVPVQRPFFRAGEARIIPLVDPAHPTRPIPVIVIVMPAAHMGALREALRREVQQLRAEHKLRRLPRLPKVAAMCRAAGDPA